tara:strand:- start:7170 stop:7787 length:618 start_codon:yes stop_codon:yes gene_type:complete
MSLNLTDIKTLLAGSASKALRDNKFSIDMSLWNPVQNQYVSIVDYPAIAVSSPTTAIQSKIFEYQNIPLQVPIKRQNSNQLLISFYANEELAIYSTLVSLIKTYGGEDWSDNSNINQPTSYSFNNMYNQAVRFNTMFIRLKSSEGDTTSGFGGAGSENVNYIGYSEVYPVSVIPMTFNSQSSDQLASFNVLFNFARTTTKNLGEI